ncbi:MAG: threonine synthase [Dehalococcoidia bacterium]|nr:threonine synthase [Dehalococcoidia bacterium]
MQCLIEKYRDFLPMTLNTPILTIGEGNTPLVRSRKLEKELGCELYFKLEGCNPTGSFKDRGMVFAVAKAVEEGSKAIACASTGNTSASAAAYGARFGLKVFVLVPKGNIALGKLAQAMIFGAQVISVDGNFDQALKMVRTITEKHPITLVNSLNPFRIEGQKTSAFEIVDALETAPDYLFLPLGNAGNITAYWKGFVEYHQAGRAKIRPKMMAFEAEGSAAIVQNRIIENPQTIATAIRIGNPASWKQAVAAREESGGVIDSVTDPQILHAYRRLAAEEGVFGEPASAASVAGLIKLAAKGLDLKKKKVVCIITGNGLKDPDTALKQASPINEVPADLSAIEKIMLAK